MIGIITGKQLFKYSFLIINEFGIKIYTVCMYKIIKGDKFTFLEIACLCKEKRHE